ncbi:Protein phosphatase methylesterase 1 [Hypoxylon texense]
MASSSESASQASIYTSVSSSDAPNHSPVKEREDTLSDESKLSISEPEPEENTASSDLPEKPKGLASMFYAKARFDRLSSFFPSLISAHSTDHSAGVLHRKPLPPNPPIQDRPPSLPSIPSIDSTEKIGGLGISNSNDTSEPPATIKHIPNHSRNSSENNAPNPTMGKLQKTAPVIEKPTPIDTFAAPSQRSTFPVAEPKPTPRLTKEQRRRSSSVTSSMHKTSSSQTSLAPRQISPIPDPRGRSSSAQPPTTRSAPPSGNLTVSTAAATAAVSRPGSSNGSQSPNRDGERRGRLRRSWLPGGRSRSHSRSHTKATTSAAWILGQNVDYNTSFIANGEKVPELWNESGTVLVYLDPKGSGAGPSFKVPSFAVDYSLVFVELMESEMTSPASSGHTRSFSGRDSLSIEDATRRVQSPPLPEPQGPGETRLYLPVSMSTPGHRSQADIERMLSIRNMFAFLTGQPLVCTKEQPNLFSVFLNISALLKEFEFTNADGSTFGDAVDMSFHFFMEQMSLADVRHSREKTLESLILGERMRSMDLYNEAFAHAVGKYPAIRDLNSPLWTQVSATTRERLERAYFELVNRQNSVNNRLESFEFPALFSGTASSTSNPDYKDVKFHTWKKSWGKMRQFVLSYYKSNFGSWPPKARSKKNPFTESGLNRQVLKILYSDFCALYDLLVDREALTTRVIDQAAEEIEEHKNPHLAALRKVLGEFDQSSPPVLPPIPFDLPMLPDMTSVKENYYELPIKEQMRLDRNLQEYQMLLILNKAYDFETFKLKMPFLDEFKEFEHKEAKGKTAAEMADQRIGYWLFLYVIIQSLPMLVVDAPGLQFTEGVEYFLCQPPKGHPPWMEDAPTVRKRWYEVAGGGGIVELSTDAVEFSIEGIYHRSHCWLAAKRWELGENTVPPALQENLSPLQAPQSVFEDMDPNRSASPTVIDRSGSPQSGPPGTALRQRTGSPAGRNSAYRSSIAFGLEPVPVPMEDMPMPGSRVVSARGISPVQRPVSGMMSRSRSSGNLIGLSGSQAQGPADTRSDSRQGSVGGSTFDDILKDMDQKPKKKRGFF